MRGQRKNPRKAVQPFENKKRKIDIFKNYEANGVEKIQRKLEIFSTLISKKSSISEHESTGDAFVTCLDGKGKIMIDGKPYFLEKGESIVMPANHPHAVYGEEDFKMMLVVVFPPM